jgi:hypothetical protein
MWKVPSAEFDVTSLFQPGELPSDEGIVVEVQLSCNERSGNVSV